KAVKPWSAIKFNWSIRSAPAWFLNIPKWGAYFRLNECFLLLRSAAPYAIVPPRVTAPLVRAVFWIKSLLFKSSWFRYGIKWTRLYRPLIPVSPRKLYILQGRVNRPVHSRLYIPMFYNLGW